MPTRSPPRLYSVRTRKEFLLHVRQYAALHGMSVSKLSAVALGNPNTLPRTATRPNYRLTLDDVNSTLSYMERNQ